MAKELGRRGIDVADRRQTLKALKPRARRCPDRGVRELPSGAFSETRWRSLPLYRPQQSGTSFFMTAKHDDMRAAASPQQIRVNA
jgi:hypothetical protein